MMRAAAIAIAAAIGCTSSALADDATTTSKQGVAVTIYRSEDKAVLCIRTRPPIRLSGEYGIHASWSPKVKPVELYAKDYFATPVRLELSLPREARMVRVEVGACVENESCDMVELRSDVSRLQTGAAPARCGR